MAPCWPEYDSLCEHFMHSPITPKRQEEAAAGSCRRTPTGVAMVTLEMPIQRLFLILLAVTCLSANSLSGRAEGLRIMPVGDSITRGLNWGGAEPGGYRTRLHHRLSTELFVNQGVRFVGTQADNPDPGNLPDPFHEGRGGWRIDQHFATIEVAVSVHRPGLVLLHLGTNDVDQDYDLAAAPGRLDALIGQIIAASPGAHVLVAQIIDSTSLTQSAKIQAFNAALPALVDSRRTAGERVYLANLFEAVSQPANYWNSGGVWDTYHPNMDGYDQLANGWFDAVVSLNAEIGGLANPSPHVLLPGDFNADGLVDGADFLVWQRAESAWPMSATELSAWQTHFGNYSGFEVASVSVPGPFPGHWTCVALVAASLGGRFRRTASGA